MFITFFWFVAFVSMIKQNNRFFRKKSILIMNLISDFMIIKLDLFI